MSLKQRLVNAFRAATHRGLKRVGILLLVGFGGLLTAAAFIEFERSWEPGPKRLTLTFEHIPADQVVGLSATFVRESAMIAAIQQGEKPMPESLRDAWDGYPAFYAWPMAWLQEAAGNRGLILFNVVCTVVAMWIVQRITIQTNKIGHSVRKLSKASEGRLKTVVKAAKGLAPQDDSSPAPVPPVTAALTGVVAMCIFAINPIVFHEALCPGPRPFAYLLSAGAIALSLRALMNQRMPFFSCAFLIVASALVHSPAFLAAVPVVLIGWFAKIAQTLEEGSVLDRLRGSSRRLAIALLSVIILPIAGRAVYSLDAVKEPVANVIEQQVPDSVKELGADLIDYLQLFEGQIGAFLVNYAPQLAVLSMVPLPSMKGIVERTMLLYGVGLVAYFSFAHPEGDTNQLYPVMIPTAILGAIGIVNTIDLYKENAVLQLAKLWTRFFAVLAAMPVVGTSMVWFSSVPVEDLHLIAHHNLGLNGVVTPYSVLVLLIAIVGLIRQRGKLKRAQAESDVGHAVNESGGKPDDPSGNNPQS